MPLGRGGFAHGNPPGADTCDHCGGGHDNVPTVRAEGHHDELGGYCPHCGGWHGLGEDDPAAIERHPTTPKDEPLTCLCSDCNGGFYLEVGA